LPKGTVIDVELIYNNSADNPANPFDPPRRIRWGQQTTNEMGSIIIGCVAYTKGMFKGDTVPAIYEEDGDTLRICLKSYRASGRTDTQRRAAAEPTGRQEVELNLPPFTRREALKKHLQAVICERILTLCSSIGTSGCP
jgi:hypothetical protein